MIRAGDRLRRLAGHSPARRNASLPADTRVPWRGGRTLRYEYLLALRRTSCVEIRVRTRTPPLPAPKPIPGRPRKELLTRMVIFAFNSSEFVGFPIMGFSTSWFETVATDPLLLSALRTSLVVVAWAVPISLAFGLLAAVQLARTRGSWRAFSVSILAVPLCLLPQALPGLLAAAFIGFALSIDEFIVTYLVTGNSVTLPLFIYSSIRYNITPELNALSSLMLLASFAFCGLAALVLRVGGRVSWGR
jgi:ABC-type sulfate transport system permease component